MQLRNNLLLGLTVLFSTALVAQAATIGVNNLAATGFDTGTPPNSGIVIIVTSVNGTSAAISPGSTIDTISFTNTNDRVNSPLTPLIFVSSNSLADFNVVSVGSPLTVASGSGTGAFTPTAGSSNVVPLAAPGGSDGYFAGFYIDPGVNNAPTGFVSNGASNVAFQNQISSAAGAPGAGDSIAVVGNLGRTYNFQVTTTPIPEPSSAMLGLLGLGLVMRRRR